MVHAGPAEDRAQERHRLIGRHRAALFGDEVEAGLDVAPGDRIKRTRSPVTQIEVGIAAVGLLRRIGPPAAGLDVVVAGLAQRRQRSGGGALAGGVLAAGHPPEQFLSAAPGLVGGDAAVASDDDPLVGRIAPAFAGAVIDDERLGAGGLHAASEPDEPVVPCDPRLVGGLQRVDGAFGEGQLHLGDPFCGVLIHGAIVFLAPG